MEEIISIIETYQEDNLHVVITDDMIKQVIEDNIEALIKDIKNEI